MALDVVRRTFPAFNDRDLSGFLEGLHEDVEWFPTHAVLLEARPYRGHGGVADWLYDITGSWESYTVEPIELEDLGGGSVLAFVHISGKGRGNRIEVETDAFAIFELKDGLITRMRTFLDEAEALAAVGRARAKR